MGVDVELFNLMENRDGFETAYPRLEIPVLYGSPQLLLNYAANYDAVVATFNTSVEWLAPLSGRELVLGYYVQDFEPYIYERGTKGFEIAMDSYTLMPDLVRFTKTEWTRRKVREATGGDSSIVEPSVDLDMFRPRPSADSISTPGPLNITAMIRPSSRYRAPQLTMRVLRRVQRRYSDAVALYLFGTYAENPGFIVLPHDFEWKLAGVLEKEQVAHLLAVTDIFVDFSEHQAMGLTAMEAMACGNAVIVPQEGGASSFAKHGHNALVIDTSSEKACWRSLKRLIEDASLRGRLRRNALEDIVSFHPERAAYNILSALFSPERDG
jgi:glycosyltransferase involved in cell wall biosynthesis